MAATTRNGRQSQRASRQPICTLSPEVKELCLSLGFLLIVGYFANVCANIASMRSPSGFVLPDLLLPLFPEIEMIYLTDIPLFTIVLTSVSLLLFGDGRFVNEGLRKIAKIALKVAAGHVLRFFTIFVTSLPDPRKNCIRVSSSIWTTMRAHRCGDCIFSGHSMILTVFLYFWMTQRGFLPMKLLAVGCAAMGFWAMLANRSHYTVDMVIGIYVGASISFIIDTLKPIQEPNNVKKSTKRQ